MHQTWERNPDVFSLTVFSVSFRSQTPPAPNVNWEATSAQDIFVNEATALMWVFSS